MLLLYDRATMAHALTLDLDPQLHALLSGRIAILSEGAFSLIDWTEFLVIMAGDTEADIMREFGFSPFDDPLSGVRFPATEFRPVWDWLIDHGGWFEMLVTFGSTFAYILFIEHSDDVAPTLQALLRHFADKPK